jgi:hypothetical protein
MSDRKDWIKVELNEAELTNAILVGRLYHADNVKRGRINPHVNDRSHKDAEALCIEGCRAEIAFAKAMNVFPRFEAGKDDAPDCYLSDGRKVDVKGTPKVDSDLLVQPWKIKPNKRADVYVLVLDKSPWFAIAGWATDTEVFVQDRWAEHMPLPCYKVPQRFLRAPRTLVEGALFHVELTGVKRAC